MCLNILMERFEATISDGSTAIRYERVHITHTHTNDPDEVIVSPPEPIVMGPISDNVEEVVS